jgi:hypothetical protein
VLGEPLLEVSPQLLDNGSILASLFVNSRLLQKLVDAALGKFLQSRLERVGDGLVSGL